MIEVFKVKIDRSDGRSDTQGSQAGPGLPAGSDVGPVPVWYSPNSPL